MKKFIDTLKNIWSITELKERILYTLLLLLVYRIGSFIVLPGVVPSVLKASFGDGSTGDLLGLINAFSGGAFFQASIMALGIMPYITASIIVQLLGFAVPYFQKLQQREGESGRKKLNQITRILTIAITLVQGTTYLAYIQGQGAVDASLNNTLFFASNLIVLTTGTMFAMWLGERITDKGVGNGVSLLITVGIIVTLPQALLVEVTGAIGSGNVIGLLILLVAFFLVVMVTVMIVQAVRKVPLQFAKRMVGRTAGQMPASSARDYLPIKVNAAGVMPIIFAQALMFVPGQIANYAAQNNDGEVSGWLSSFADFTSVPYNILSFFLVVVFTYVYTALLVNPQQQAEYLKRQNAFIPGIKPGKPTADFLDSTVSRITLPGSIFLGLITILPAFAAGFGVNTQFALFFGGTSLLILVAVVLDTLQQIESYLLMRRYDGLMKSGKLKGRGGIQGIGASM